VEFARFVRRAVLLLAIGLTTLPPLGAATTPALTPPPVTVSGNLLLRGGAPWVPRGFVMVAALSPTRTGAGGRAFANLSDAAMQAARSWGADSLRFQVSQRGLDPEDGLFGGERYIGDIRAAVDLASAHGFNVILSVQDQSLSGGTAHPQPSPATRRAWGTLTAELNGRPDIMYELFNEPQNHDGVSGWAVWRDGGPAADNQGDPAIGHQPLLDYIRSTGSTNVVIVDGGRWGGSLKGVPLLHDPLGQLAYGVHPYLANAALDVADWDARFGYLTGTVPVIATEWNAHSSMGICRPEWPQISQQLLGYLAAHRIGLYGWAFDIPNSLVKDWSRNPTSFDGYQCGVSGGGAGELIRAYFLGDAPPVPPPTGGPPAGPPPVLSFGPSADATVRSSDPDRNFGTDTLLRADRGPGAAMESYVRFDVRGLAGPPGRAVLRLHVVRGSATGPSVFRTGNGWKESGREGITWANRPDRRGGPLAARGAATADLWVEYDVTEVVNGNGTFSFVVATGSIDGTDFSSRHAAPGQRPELVVTPAR
jgi:endoglucanase